MLCHNFDPQLYKGFHTLGEVEFFLCHIGMH